MGNSSHNFKNDPPGEQYYNFPDRIFKDRKWIDEIFRMQMINSFSLASSGQENQLW